MIIAISAFILVAAATFLLHDWLERMLVRKYGEIALVWRGYHIHHSVYGVLAICLALLIGGKALIIGGGFGLGNLWQHKATHNRQNEKGLVLVTRDSGAKARNG
ncbi:MAG: hypothetical protein ACM3NH_02035 [Candidatus Saccharibacteria bacterium]